MAKKTYKPEPGPGVECDYTVTSKYGEKTEFGSNALGAAVALVGEAIGKAPKMPPDVELAALRGLRGDLTTQVRLQLRVESELDDLAEQTKGKRAERDAIIKNITELITAPLGGKLPFPPAEEKEGE